MKWVSYIWSTFAGLVTLLIAVAVIDSFSEPFQRVVVDLLVMVYVAVQSGVQTNGFIAVEQAKTDRNRFLALMKATGDAQFENEDQKETIREDDERSGRSMVKGYIQAAFIFLIFLVALINLLGAL